jgi:hypothetical protein
MYNKVADSGDVVIREQGFSIVGIHGPAIAMPQLPLCSHVIKIKCHEMPVDAYPHRNRIFLAGRRQEVRPCDSSGLHFIISVSGSNCGMSRNKDIHRLCSVRVFHLQVFRMVIYWGRYPGAGENGGGMNAVLWLRRSVRLFNRSICDFVQLSMQHVSFS